MADMVGMIYNINHMDDLARKDTPVHRIHPLVKLMATTAFIIAVVSFDRHEVWGLLAFFVYPAVVFSVGEIPVKPVFRRVLAVEPFIVMIGILNPLFEKQSVVLGGVIFSEGWVAFLSVLIKSTLTVTAALLLVATTGMDRLAAALRMLKVPKIFVLQLLLTYRYISVLVEEAARIMRAYLLRAGRRKGIYPGAWGSFAGQLVLRSFDRAQRVYQAMCMRGFEGEYNTGDLMKLKPSGLIYLSGWVLFFAVARICNIPLLLGRLLTGGM